MAFDRLRAMTKKKTKGSATDYLTVEMMMSLDMPELGKFAVEFEPEEQAAATAALVSVVKELNLSANASRGTPLPSSKRMSEAVQLYLEMLTADGVPPKTRMNYEGDLSQLCCLLGDKPLSSLTHEDFNNAKLTLSRLPPNINKLPALRGKSTEAILALKLAPQASRTVAKKWDRLVSFLNWAVNHGHVVSNLAAGKKPKAKGKSYEELSDDDLAKLFETPHFQDATYDQAFKYWLPVLGLYTGARIEELAQLELADFKVEGDNVFVHFTELPLGGDAGHTKQLKTESSERVCPIHPAVVDAGLLTFLKALGERGHKRLFPELVVDRYGKVGPRASEWFTAYRRQCEVGSPSARSTKAFHSFRKTLINRMLRAGVAEELRERIAGHEGATIHRKVYATNFSTEQLSAAIRKVSFAVKLSPFIDRVEHEDARQKAASRTARAQRTANAN